MTNREINTENRIFRAACDVFLLYGYHGTKLQKIAVSAGINKSVIHYYFRSKERLYIEVVKEILNHFPNTEVTSSSEEEMPEKPIWFLCTELYNNRNLFESTLKHLYPEDWENTLKNIVRWIEIGENLHSFQLNEKNGI